MTRPRPRYPDPKCKARRCSFRVGLQRSGQGKINRQVDISRTQQHRHGRGAQVARFRNCLAASADARAHNELWASQQLEGGRHGHAVVERECHRQILDLPTQHSQRRAATFRRTGEDERRVRRAVQRGKFRGNDDSATDHPGRRHHRIGRRRCAGSPTRSRPSSRALSIPACNCRTNAESPGAQAVRRSQYATAVA